ncbi:MAG: hypothetical protein LC627_00725 [Verrucomicrobiaceae bacterium]|nr:hypothetical protein [Verrucomicrobiaceae bacterium]
MRSACVLTATAILSILHSADAALQDLRGLDGLTEVEFAQLSQRDSSALGAKALAIHPEQWKHAETEHFIYHFVRRFVATRLSVEAEFHYRVVTKTLEREQPPGNTKSHIYIFEEPAEWQQFQKLGELEDWTGGIHSEGALFVQRDPAYKFAGNLLGHEIAHLVLYRFYGDSIPCWLDEGFAQYVSKAARSSYQRARGYISRPHSTSLAPEAVIPLARLMSLDRAPSDAVETFYDQSERLVRFLASTNKSRFLALLDALGHAESFDAAFARIYIGEFSNRADFEEKFKSYASKDFGSSSQQVDVD